MRGSCDLIDGFGWNDWKETKERLEQALRRRISFVNRGAVLRRRSRIGDGEAMEKHTAEQVAQGADSLAEMKPPERIEKL